MKLEDLTQPGWGDLADYFRETGMMYGTTELKVPAVIKLHLDNEAATAASTTFGELMECLDIMPRISQMLHGTSRSGFSHMTLGSGRQQTNKRIASLPPDPEPNLSPILKAKLIQPVSLHLCIIPSN